MILDTSFLIDVLRGDETVEAAMQTVDASGTARSSAVTVVELRGCIHLTDASVDERAAVENLLDSIPEVPFDRDCANEAGRINAALETESRPIDPPDVMIAATARVHDRPIVAANGDHFERIDDADFRTYRVKRTRACRTQTQSTR